jgi:hypothetical protein
MPPTQADSRGPKNPGADAGRRRVSWAMVLLGAALLACALALYWYAFSNTPRTLKEPDNLGNINRATPARPTPAASPSGTRGANGGARPAR